MDTLSVPNEADKWDAMAQDAENKHSAQDQFRKLAERAGVKTWNYAYRLDFHSGGFGWLPFPRSANEVKVETVLAWLLEAEIKVHPNRMKPPYSTKYRVDLNGEPTDYEWVFGKADTLPEALFQAVMELDLEG